MDKNGVSFEASVGAFDGDRMVGFALTGLDTWAGEPAAFEACTGVVREFRGCGVAPAIFERVADKPRAGGVKRYLLEVLQQNRPAVQTYKKAGFPGHARIRLPAAVAGKAAPGPAAARARRGDRAGEQGSVAGLRALRRLAVAVERGRRRRGIGSALVAAIARDLAGRVPVVRMANVDHADQGMLAWPARAGFEIYARQYEMALDL